MIIKRIILLCLVVSIFLMGCPEHTCKNYSINPAFIGFAPADIDTIIIRAYTRDDNFHHLVDTTIVINRNSVIYTTSNDTTVVDTNSGNPESEMSPAFDWQIYIPAKHRTVSVSNILSEATSGNRGCSNPIISFVEDGQTITPYWYETNRFYTTGYRVFIHN